MGAGDWRSKKEEKAERKVSVLLWGNCIYQFNLDFNRKI